MQVITHKSFVISDDKIINYMRNNGVRHIGFYPIYEDGEAFISVKFPDYKNQLVFGKEWLQVIYGKKKVYVRTPEFLKPHIGKSIEVYRDEVFASEFEIFKIKMIGFKIYHKNFPDNIRKIKMNVPYFSNNGCCVIPKQFIREQFETKILGYMISFNRTTESEIDGGHIYSRIMKHRDRDGILVFRLSEHSNGVRAKAGRLFDFVSSCGKDILNFKYKCMIEIENYSMIVFEEVKLK